MYEYLISGRAEDERSVTEIVEAPSGDEAVRLFEEQGHADVVLHTGEFAALLSKPSKWTNVFRPREMVAGRTMGKWQIAALAIRKLYGKLWGSILIPVGAAAFWLVFDGSVGVWAAIAGLSLAVPLLLGLYIQFLGAGARHRRLLEAIGWGRWAEALRIIERGKFAFAPFEGPLRKAQALAGLGRMSEALAELDALDNDPECPRPVYWGFLTLIYAEGRDWPNALVAVERAHELAPANPDILIDNASLLILARGDLAGARGLLAEARRHVLADGIEPFARAVEGRIAWAEKRYPEAVAHFEEAVRRADPFLRGNPALRYILARLWAYLALSYAGAGDHEAARREAARAEPVLAAHRDEEMLRKLRAAVG